MTLLNASCRVPSPLVQSRAHGWEVAWVGGTWDNPTARSMEPREPDEQETSRQMLPVLGHYTTTEKDAPSLAPLLPASFTGNNLLQVRESPSGMFPLDLPFPV